MDLIAAYAYLIVHPDSYYIYTLNDVIHTKMVSVFLMCIKSELNFLFWCTIVVMMYHLKLTLEFLFGMSAQ